MSNKIKLSEYNVAFIIKLEVLAQVYPFIVKDSDAGKISKYKTLLFSKSPAGGVICAATDCHRVGIAYDEFGKCEKDISVYSDRIIKLFPKPRKTQYNPWIICTQIDKENGFFYEIVTDGIKYGQANQLIEKDELEYDQQLPIKFNNYFFFANLYNAFRRLFKIIRKNNVYL